MQVNIYIETDTKSPKRQKRRIAYVLEAIVRGEAATRTAIEEVEETYHGATLRALEKALARLTKPCDVKVYAQDAWVLGMLTGQIEKWKDANFLNAKGKPIADQAVWLHIWVMTEYRTVTAAAGPHAYSNWMIREMQKAKGDQNDGKTANAPGKTAPAPAEAQEGGDHDPGSAGSIQDQLAAQADRGA